MSWLVSPFENAVNWKSGVCFFHLISQKEAMPQTWSFKAGNLNLSLKSVMYISYKLGYVYWILFQQFFLFFLLFWRCEHNICLCNKLLIDLPETITMKAIKIVCYHGNGQHIVRRWQSGWNPLPKLRDFKILP